MLNQRPHKNLELWQKAIDFVTNIYEATKEFPKAEEFGLKSQLRRAAISVPSNIAEGLTRRTNADKIHFLVIANGSLSEIDTQLEISLKLNFINIPEFELLENKLIVVQKLLSGLIRCLKN